MEMKGGGGGVHVKKDSMLYGQAQLCIYRWGVNKRTDAVPCLCTGQDLGPVDREGGGRGGGT